MTFKKKRKMVSASHPIEVVRPDFPPGGFPGPEAVSPEARRQMVLLDSRRKGIKKAPIALAAATVASMFAAGWGTVAQAQEATDPKGAPVITTQQAKVAGEVAEEVAKREQDPANDAWIEKALASILEGDVVPFVALADAMLAGVGGEDLVQAFDGDEGSKDEPEGPSPSGSEKEQSGPKAEGSEHELAQADDSTPERASSGGVTKGAEEAPAQAPSGSSPEEDGSRVGGAEDLAAEQGSDPKPESDEVNTSSGGTTVNGATGTGPTLSSGSSSEDGSSDTEQAGESFSVAFSLPSSSEDTESGDGVTTSEPEDASGRSGETPSADAGESSVGSYEYDTSSSARGDVDPASEEVPFGFSPTEDGEPPEGTSNEEIGASDESKKAVENYLEGGEEKYLEYSLKKDVEDKAISYESGVPGDEGNSFAESDEETDEGQALGEGFGFGSLEEDVEETPPEHEVAVEETSSEEAPDVKEELPARGFEVAGSSGEEHSSQSGVPEALRDFLEATSHRTV